MTKPAGANVVDTIYMLCILTQCGMQDYASILLLKKKKKKNFTSFGQPTRLITCANHGNTATGISVAALRELLNPPAWFRSRPEQKSKVLIVRPAGSLTNFSSISSSSGTTDNVKQLKHMRTSAIGLQSSCQLSQIDMLGADS